MDDDQSDHICTYLGEQAMSEKDILSDLKYDNSGEAKLGWERWLMFERQTIDRVAAEIERLRARVEECEQRRLSADDARKMVRALWCAGFREGELEHRESVSAAKLNKSRDQSQRCGDAIISALTWGSKP
jgi:hypothetical protein